jgi:hypothetical protein
MSRTTKESKLLKLSSVITFCIMSLDIVKLMSAWQRYTRIYVRILADIICNDTVMMFF